MAHIGVLGEDGFLRSLPADTSVSHWPGLVTHSGLGVASNSWCLLLEQLLWAHGEVPLGEGGRDRHASKIRSCNCSLPPSTKGLRLILFCVLFGF